MRSISFGPTSYFESRLDSRHDDHDNNEDNQYGSLNLQNQAAIDRPTANHRNSNRAAEVIFYSCNNLFRESLVGHKELAMKKNCKCRFAFDPLRTFQSYCYEFCGLLNIHFADLKFFMKNREVPMQRQTRKPCTIEVYPQNNLINSSKLELYSLKPAYSELLEKGLFSDMDIVVNGEQAIKAHKCILIARSEKFKVMLQNNMMKEAIEGKVEINDKELTLNVYKLLIQWIYEGECDLPDSVPELISLLKLTDEYLLPDLQKVCEDQIIDLMDERSAVDILLNVERVFPLSSEQPIKEAAKSVFLEDYEKIEELYPDIELKIAQVKGLMSELFVHKKKKKQSHRKRKGSILGDDSQKKKVRFNISNTIYEEASAIHDESDSLIEPLSIYSNSSPPGEYNDDIMVSSTHSSLHAGVLSNSNNNNNSERRHSGVIQNNNQLIPHAGIGNIDGVYSGSGSEHQRRTQQHVHGHPLIRGALSPSNRLLRPASAGRNENTHQNFRSNSSLNLGSSVGNNSDNRGQENNGPSQTNDIFGMHSDRFNSLI